jgi:hypothetical protein
MRWSFLVLAVSACGNGGGGDGRCRPGETACSYANDFPVRTVAGGEEVDGLCQSWTLHNPEELWVNTVVLANEGGYHHSNWFFVPDDTFEIPDGAWPCDEHNFDEVTAAILGGVLFAQSTQSTEETQAFPPGAAVRIPPYSRVIGSTHILNAADDPLETGLHMSISTIPEAQVTVKLAPFRLTYYDLAIPPMGTAEFASACDVKTTYEETMGQPFSLKLSWALPHYHQLATAFSRSVVGGARDGEVILTNDGWGTDTFGRAFDPPVDISDGTGFHFSCTFANPRAEEVGWGIGDQEMCVMLGFAEIDMAFDASVGSGVLMSTDPDGTQRWGGGCDILGFPFFQDTEGGDGP